jgi:hypothetical protein
VQDSAVVNRNFFSVSNRPSSLAIDKAGVVIIFPPVIHMAVAQATAVSHQRVAFSALRPGTRITLRHSSWRLSKIS